MTFLKTTKNRSDFTNAEKPDLSNSFLLLQDGGLFLLQDGGLLILVEGGGEMTKASKNRLSFTYDGK